MYTWGSDPLGIKTFQLKGTSNLRSLKTILLCSWTFDPWRQFQTFMGLCLDLPRKFRLARSSRIRVRTQTGDRWLVSSYHRDIVDELLLLFNFICYKPAIGSCLGLGWCHSHRLVVYSKKSISGNGCWYIKKVQLYQSCPCFQAWCKKKAFSFREILKKSFKEVFSLMEYKEVLCPWSRL